jgi:type II pantothenate kinase
VPILCQLSDPAGYRPFDWDLRADPADLNYWLGLFETFPGNIERRLREDGLAGDDFDERWRAFCEAYQAGIDLRRAAPVRNDVTTITLGEFRQRMLDEYGWPDPYARLKKRENDLAAPLYPQVVARIDAAAARDRWELLLCGVFAGNMFDLGSPATIELYHRGEISFPAMLERIPPRPWFIDDADAVIDRLSSPDPWRQALFFVDNAGTDIVLGVVPLVREMARGGTQVVLAANSTPALNDVTIAELDPLLRQLASADAVLAELLGADQITTVASGSGSPLIDLSRISNACDAAAAASDLIVLEGMGRGVESNWRQSFKCDVCRIALVKDACVAKWLACDLFQPVCRFDPVASSVSVQ